MKSFAIFLVGCVFGAVLMGAVLTIRKGIENIKSLGHTEVYSDAEVRQRIKESGIDLPPDSWNLFYAINGFQDHGVWIAFTVSPDRLWSVVEASLEKKREDFTSGIPENFLVQLELGPDQKIDTSVWAPKSVKNPLHFSIPKGSSYFEDWVVDEEGGRIFITKQNT